MYSGARWLACKRCILFRNFGWHLRAYAPPVVIRLPLEISGINRYSIALVLKIILGWNINVSILVSSITMAIYVTLGGLHSAIFNEVLQFILIWAGALLIPILGLIEAGGWSALKARISTNASAEYTHLWSTLGKFSDNPMGIHWTGMVFRLGAVISRGYWTTDFSSCSACFRRKICARRKWPRSSERITALGFGPHRRSTKGLPQRRGLLHVFS
jgi:SSS family solute:Na+ symporter